MHKSNALKLSRRVHMYSLAIGLALFTSACSQSNIPFAGNGFGGADQNLQGAITTQGSTGCGNMSAQSCQVLQLTNQERAAAGVAPVTYCPRCAAMAYEQSMDVVQRGYFAHDRPAAEDRPAETFQQRFGRFQIGGFGGGENLAQGANAAGSMQMWMNSPGHKANILNPNFVSMGVGEFNGTFTQVFSTAQDNSAELPRILVSKSSGFQQIDKTFKYDTDLLYKKMTGVTSNAVGCIEAYIPSRGQNDSACRTQNNWLAIDPINAQLSGNPDWKPYASGDQSFTFGNFNPNIRILKGHPYLPNAFGRYKLYVKNNTNDPYTVVMFEIQPGVQPTPTPVPTPAPTPQPTPQPTPNPGAIITGGPINTNDINAVKSAYKNWFQAPGGYLNWTGNINSCIAGYPGAGVREATISTVNFMRALAGLPGTVGLDATMSNNAQEAALMMAANGQLNHAPPNTWKCYTQAGYSGASTSNLAMGATGSGAVQMYMDDPGSNYFVGHRRWILYPPQSMMGSGSVQGADALSVIGGWGSRPATPNGVAWPSPGYFPRTLTPGSRRWSFSYQYADFSSATVSMRKNGTSMAITQETPVAGYADETLVWNAPLADGSTADYDVTISNVMVGGSPRTFSYTVRMFDAEAP